MYKIINPIQDGGKQKAPPSTSFSHVISTNVGRSPQNVLAFSFNPFPTLVQNLHVISSAGPKLLNSNQNHDSKKVYSGQILIKLRL